MSQYGILLIQYGTNIFNWFKELSIYSSSLKGNNIISTNSLNEWKIHFEISILIINVIKICTYIYYKNIFLIIITIIGYYYLPLIV